MNRKNYTVRATRWDHGWELDIEDVGGTQSHTLNDAEDMVRDYIRLALDVAADAFDVTIIPDVGEDLVEKAQVAKEATAAAEQMRDAAARSAREVARRLSEKGLRGKEIAIILGVSNQRVSQLLRDGQTGKVVVKRGRSGAMVRKGASTSA